MATTAPWWRDAVIYQVYPRSFADSSGDGIGDLTGIVDRLDHLEWLGVDAVWLNPTMPSPNADWGYDVADYRGVHPDLGTSDDLDRLISEAGRRGLRVLLDLVPNHTSDQHPWFVDSRSSRDSGHRDWYVWADGKDGGPPNNWLSVFGGDVAWEFDEGSRQWYLHNFLARQPDLNWWNEEVRRAIDDVISYWFDRGIAGFRIDVAHALVKDAELRDNPPATVSDHPHFQRVGQLPIYNMNRPESHEVLKRWRRLAETYGEPDRILVGETYVLEVEQLAAFYGTGADQLHMAFNFPFALAEMEAETLADVIERTERLLPRTAWPAWTASNHDIGRLATRWGDDDERKVRCALMLLLTLRGTPFLYYGDEIGLGHVAVPFERLKDPVGLRYWPREQGRDPCRTPMHWDASEGAGFTAAGVEPWLPLGDASTRNVADQRSDAGSVLHLCRDLIALRRSSHDLRSAPYSDAVVDDGLWRWRRGRVGVALNMSPRPRTVSELSGRVAISTTREQDDSTVRGPLRLDAWEGVVVAPPT